jgi:two-component system cell cycle response regulator DivK
MKGGAMSRRVMIVEDETLNARVFECTLKHIGDFEVTITEDVDQILQMAKAKEVDLILMDVSLANSYYQGKHVDGVDITKILKQNPETEKIPVLLATAHAMKGDRERFLQETSADDYIAKPIVVPKELVKKVNTLLRLRQTE